MATFASHFERNPFATRYVRPSAVGYRFMDAQSAEQLIDRLRQNHWTGEIVGPHGSGKSTLLRALIPLMEKAGREVMAYTLHLGESRLPIAPDEMTRFHERTQLVIDGYEQLSSRSRRQIMKACQSTGSGMLVTSHEATGLPVIYRTSSTLDLVQSLVRELQEGGPMRVRDGDVAMTFERHQGNVRDVLFELYDIFEQRRS